MSSCRALGLQTQPDWISQVPRLFFHHALPAFTPTGRLDACADYFSNRNGFTISGRLTTCKLCNEADSSSPFRIAAHGFAVRLVDLRLFVTKTDLAPRTLLPPCDRPQLRVQSAINTINTFQFIRIVRLILTHLKHTDRLQTFICFCPCVFVWVIG